MNLLALRVVIKQCCAGERVWSVECSVGAKIELIRAELTT